MKKLILLLTILPFLGFSQIKKELDHSAYNEWRSVEKQLVSNDGTHIAYTLKPNGYGNESLMLHQFDGTLVLEHDRSYSPSFTNNSQFLLFKVSPDFDELRDLKRKKTKEKDLPGDTLAIYNIASGSIEKISGLKSYKVPKEWDNYVVYLYEPAPDTTKKKEKKRSKKNGYDLVVKNLNDNSDFTFSYVLDFEIAEEGAALALTTTGNDSTIAAGVYRFDFDDKIFKPIYRSKGEYSQLAWDKKGNQLSFISDTDTTKALKRDYHLHYYKTEWDSSKTIAKNETLDNLIVNNDFKPNFSESGKRLFFEVKEFPVLQDTSLLDEEIVNVEVWNYQDQRLFTHQENEKKDDLKFGYLNYYDVESNKQIKLGGPDYSRVIVSDEGDGNTALAMSDYNYRKLITWEGYTLNDLYRINLSTGEKTKVADGVRGFVQLSPKGKYGYWYNNSDSSWFTYSFSDDQVRQITTNREVPFFNEIHDTPSDPWPYGLMSWTENDERVLIYDRYDIWELDPSGKVAGKRITPNGRAEKLTYRYVKLDKEERFIKKNQKLLLSGFYETDKREALFSFTYGKNKPTKLISGDFQYSSFAKARDSKNLIFTQENFQTFPDILATEVSFGSIKKVSDINPQQKEYKWGTIELVNWTSLDGQKMEGMLVKPEGFDPSKKYPMIVNFYEKSSNGLNRHREPYPGRSTITYSFYASRGYLIFNPNVNYKTGYPGEDAYNCVIPGVTSLIEKGFVDEDNVGVQGHSWGGYQIAHLINETNIFKCAESGAPVVNMISAYGGIRWGSGLSRMFQYERTQSRIGGSLWEYPLRYIENSPIFFVDKVQTPVLIMHNDEDGAVPWYQGIEYFGALRRLGKPAWLLNYRGEPHWPVKVQNRIDFNIRMAQFFDYYLKGAPMPKWMRDGVPATELGINQGYELLEGE
ncbi:Dipeptidyl aminopeptidase/acylaminoacyl peptidase [Ekhidna lutea]|uniref:Dipeptidyl aminopeptidase/acylaminoacyl peptidase n=2 Tax=Ekhidna lutea TaxID=447679 RepID=A0A239EVH5_EKHLU|nr:Dipeptidyl aminopeptidase/acylaminoacyl peptidase [Ekhidna lutea]